MIPPDFSSVLSPSTHQDSLTPLTQVRDRSWECTTRPTPPSALQASSAPHRCKALDEHLSTCRGEPALGTRLPSDITVTADLPCPRWRSTWLLFSSF
ncbi:uncharacterized protein QC761_123765 [Podospora bellae-mahoneyi]|uniref:Uncharacterized protein n=1 Tax=Podospora bellae-mahoneyi TaxID=2093777 RepID=A0ABR0FWC8_9PEZI|nr:hypothetical protein QC761_123765 [Podospora bellae-mahoneyi]